MSTVAVLLVGACADEPSDESDGTESASENDESAGTDGDGGMCDGSATTADCASYCTGVVAASCAGGPATQAECEQGCEMLNAAVGQCPAWGVLVECAQAAPAFACFMDEPVPEGCEEEFYCVSLCFE
jgi:hypothetical protein